ncbi:hypothetical protein FC35_GL000694 [Limosilactobacillus coleohominis DSM 14060]|nr:hypothetical protein FC35_GL000694 [Limosilactobacillus coleohominis DSM 14060]
MRRHIFLAYCGFETAVIGLFLFMERQWFMDDQHDKFIHMAHHLGDIDWALMLVCIGLVAMVIGVFDVVKFHSQSVILIILGALWFAYFVVFLLQDIHFHQPIRLATIMTGLNFMFILVETRYGGGWN